MKKKKRSSRKSKAARTPRDLFARKSVKGGATGGAGAGKKPAVDYF